MFLFIIKKTNLFKNALVQVSNKASKQPGTPAKPITLQGLVKKRSQKISNYLLLIKPVGFLFCQRKSDILKYPTG